jgi:nitrogen fixation/metabolism regulation signal transduction histidine kinase
MVVQELEEAYEPVYALMKTLLALGLVALVALYLTVLLTARAITIPLDRLRRGTQRVRDGDLRERVDLLTGDELQELAESFNEMTEKLRVSYEDLHQRTRQLEQSLETLGQSEARYRSVLETSPKRHFRL